MSKWKIHPNTEHYFCTTAITGWCPIFTGPAYFNILINSLQFCSNNKGLKIHAYVIMLNHLHLIASSGSSSSLSDIMRDFKRHTSKELSFLLQDKNQAYALHIFKKEARKKNQNYKVWQDGFHPIALQREHFYFQKLNYIHENPVRKGYVKKPEHWVYSSARNYVEDPDVAMPIDELELF